MARDARPTLDDIAEAVGCSRPAVSYALNGGPGSVSAALKDRIHAEALRLGYARRPRSPRRGSDVVALVAPSLAGPFFGGVLDQIERELADLHCNLVAGCSHERPADEARVVESLLRHRPVGLIAVPCSTDPDWLANVPSRTNLVILDRPLGSRALAAHALAVTLDHGQAAQTATAHLISHGCSRIACIAGPREASSTAERQQGWMDAASSYGLETEGLISYAGADERSGRLQTRRMLAAKPDGIVFMSDAQALGGLRAAHEMGVDVGATGVLMISIDGASGAAFSVPSLTTLTQPVPKMAKTAVAAALNIGGHTVAPRPFPARLDRRESCGCQHRRTGQGASR